MKDLALAIFGVGVLAFVAFLCWLTHSTAPFWGLLILLYIILLG